MVTDVPKAVSRIAQEETSALVKLLEAPGRKVLVVVAWVEDGLVTLTSASSSDTVVLDARAYVQALDRERDRIASLLVRKTNG